jgi:hypothetical protein
MEDDPEVLSGNGENLPGNFTAGRTGYRLSEGAHIFRLI